MANHDSDKGGFQLKCDFHYEGLKEVCEKCLETGAFVDVTLACVGEREVIQAHKLLLCAFSLHFQKLFVKNPHQHYFLLEDISLHHLKAFIKYFYTGVLTVPREELQNYLTTAKSLEIKGLMPKEFIANTVSVTSELPAICHKSRNASPVRSITDDEHQNVDYFDSSAANLKEAMIEASDIERIGNYTNGRVIETDYNSELKLLTELESTGDFPNEDRDSEFNEAVQPDVRSARKRRSTRRNGKNNCKPTVPDVVCADCHRVFKNVPSLSTHKSFCNRVFACHLCPTRYSRPANLKHHLERAHENGAVSLEDQNPRRNDEDDRTKRLTYLCRKCSRWFETIKSVMIHEQQSCSGKKRLSARCPSQNRDAQHELQGLEEPSLDDLQSSGSSLMDTSEAEVRDIHTPQAERQERRASVSSDAAELPVNGNTEPEKELSSEKTNGKGQGSARKEGVRESRSSGRFGAVKVHVVVCKMCASIFSSKQKLYEHPCCQRQSGLYTCPKCDKTFQHQRSLYRHESCCSQKFNLQYDPVIATP